MSTGSLFQSIQDSLKLLKDLQHQYKYKSNVRGESAPVRRQSVANINEMLEELSTLLRIYDKFILDLSVFATGDHVTPEGAIKDIETLKAFQKNIETFQTHLASVMAKINQLPDVDKDPLLKNFDDKSVQKALTKYHTQCQETFKVLDLPHRIKNLEKEVTELNTSFDNANQRRIKKKKESKYTPFHLHKKSNSNILDVGKIAADIELQKKSTTKKYTRAWSKAVKYEENGLKCALCCAFIVTLPILAICAAVFFIKAVPHERKTTEAENRFKNLDHIEKDIQSIQGAWEKLGQHPANITMETQKEIDDKIEAQVKISQKDLQCLATDLKIDINERPKYSPRRT